jgi:hypothetical protein
VHGLRPIAALGLILAAVLATAAGASSSGSAPKLALDGTPFAPELALTPAARSKGLMLRKFAPADGMLFVFPQSTVGGFWMKNTLAPLTIAFFAADGKRVRKLSMTPCRQDPCPIYDPGRRYRFALELRASDTRPAKRLGPISELRRLVRRAS